MKTTLALPEICKTANLSLSSSVVSWPDKDRPRPALPLTDSSVPTTKKPLWIPAVLWAVFLAGLALQLFSPHLSIAHNAFVIPPSLADHGSTLDPRALVQKERMIQSFSALFSLTGAIGLGLYYRRSLLRHLLGKDDQ